MPRKVRQQLLPETCSHTLLSLAPCSHAAEVGYKTPQESEQAATTQSLRPKSNPQGKRKRDVDQSSSKLATRPQKAELVPPFSATFPGPLVLPGDELSLDPDYPPQSLHEWLHEEERNEVKLKKNVIYVAEPPDVPSDLDFIRIWTQPQLQGERDQQMSSKPAGTVAGEVSAAENLQYPVASDFAGGHSITPPSTEDVVEYLAAFYQGLPVRAMPLKKLSYDRWESGGSKSGRAKAKPSSTTPTLYWPEYCFGVYSHPNSSIRRRRLCVPAQSR